MPAASAHPQPYLQDKHFLAAILFAIALHLAALLAWTLLPKEPVKPLHVHVLNIQLGSDDMPILPRNVLPVGPDQQPARAIQSTPPPSTPELLTRHIGQAVEALAKAGNPEPQQYVPPPAGTRTAAEAEKLQRYSLLLSRWVKRFQIYPATRIKGTTVVVVQIDRRGNVRYAALDKSSGVEMMDRAALQMIQDANPMPPVPEDYKPEQVLFEFKFPIVFSPL